MSGPALQPVVVATGNRHKLAEIRTILAGLPVTLLPMSDFALAEPVEDGDTFEANALIKARACAEATGLAAIADDSGLEVDALGGAPGIFSARYAGESATDAQNNAKLVEALADVAVADRTARYVCAAAFVAPDGDEHVVRGVLQGWIAEHPRGTYGFGYDPYFLPRNEESRTCAELSPSEKDAISHRGEAFRELRRRIEPLLVG